MPSLEGSNLQDARRGERGAKRAFVFAMTFCLGGKDHEASPARSSRELWIRQLFPLAGLLESGHPPCCPGDHCPELEN